MRLEQALATLATAMVAASDPWWVIGSAAVRLHGAATEVADIDVLTSRADAEALLARWPGAVVRGAASPRFRSTPFARLDGAALPIEVMGALEVEDGGEWHRLSPTTRVALGGVLVPDRAELLAILRRFGRDKDRRRAALLEAVGSS